MKEFTPTSQQQPKEKEPEKPAEPEAAPAGKNPIPTAAGTTKRAPVREVRSGGIRQELRLSQSGVILPICLYAKTKSDTTTVSEDVDIAPYGRLLRCELANTISTSSLQTPVIALVTESLWWDGVEIIPAGVEVHGTVSGSPSRDRIGTSSSWIVIYPYRDHRSVTGDFSALLADNNDQKLYQCKYGLSSARIHFLIFFHHEKPPI